MGLPDLYPAQVGSPYTTLAAPYTTGEATMTVVDATKLPDAPNIVCLAGSVAGEFRYSGKDGNTLLGVIELPGTPNATWLIGTYAFRGIAAYDHNSLKTHAARGSIPELRNRVVFEKDGAGNTLEIHEVWIPQFRSKYWSQENLNNLDCGGFWIDKYQACMFDATGSSRGSVSPNNPGLNGAACKPHVVPWTDINWYNARAAIENRGGSANKATGTCAPYSGGSTTQFYVEHASHLIGRRVYITQGGVTYVRRVVRTGGDTAADPNAAKLVEFYPALPAPVTSDDEYTIVRRFLPGGYEWFSLAALARILMVECGLPYCKGNTDWGKFHGDPRERVYEGIPDPVEPGYQGNAVARVLTGSGPRSWSLNGKESGVWDLKGNVWEWVDLRIGTAADYTIDAEYPGAGHLLPSTDGYVQALYDPAPDGARSLGAEIFAPKTIGSAQAEFDSNYYYQNTGQRAAFRGGNWDSAASAGLFSLNVGIAPSYVRSYIGFRGVC